MDDLTNPTNPVVPTAVDPLVPPATNTEPTPPAAEPTPTEKIPYERFKAKVDEANELKAKLAKIEEAEAAKVKAEQLAQGKFEQIAEDLQKQLDAAKADALSEKKNAMLIREGYSAEQIERYSKFVVGASEVELQASLDELKADVPPKKAYADPAQANPPKSTPAPKDLHTKGKSSYQRLKDLGRIR